MLSWPSCLQLQSLVCNHINRAGFVVLMSVWRRRAEQAGPVATSAPSSPPASRRAPGGLPPPPGAPPLARPAPPTLHRAMQCRPLSREAGGCWSRHCLACTTFPRVAAAAAPRASRSPPPAATASMAVPWCRWAWGATNRFWGAGQGCGRASQRALSVAGLRGWRRSGDQPSRNQPPRDQLGPRGPAAVETSSQR